MSDTIKKPLTAKIKTFFKWLIPIVLVIISGLYYLGTLSDSFSWSYWSASIASKGTIKTEVYTLDVKGAKVRLYTFVEPDGTPCSAIFGSRGISKTCDYTKKVRIP